MTFGYCGKILHVDLSAEDLTIEQPDDSFYRMYGGGSAMGLYYLLRDMPPGTAALAPESILTLMTGPTTGVPISGQSRLNVNARSPLTGAVGDSQSGGFFPAELKFAGFDGIVIKGRASRPLYLSIIAGQPVLHDARHLMGKLTAEVEDLLREAVQDPRAEVLQCGPAAEKGVRYSSLVNMANRNNGRTGMGLVMAGKNLKAIVVRGEEKVQVTDRAALMSLARSGPKMLSGNADVEELGIYGTAGIVNWQNSAGTLPSRNYNEGQFEDPDAISGQTMAETILKQRDTCYACIVRCKRVVEIENGKYSVNPRYGGPEYETVATFGSYCGINDLAAIAKANEICNAYGVDTISCGATIAFAMECFEKGIIGLGETGGLDLRFGNAEAMLETLHQIVSGGSPLGLLLGQGSAEAANTWGEAAQDCLITVKGQEAPAHMPQAKKSLALIYAVNPFGADHQSSEHDPMYEEDAGDLYLSRLAKLGLTSPQPYGDLGPEKVRFAARTQIFYSLLDTLELCQFVWGPAWTLYGPDETVELVRAATGWDVDLNELMQIGERRVNMLRVFNAREGFNRQHDTLPNKFFKPLGGSGPTAGVKIDPQHFQEILDYYYHEMGWTMDGIPTRSKLNALGLDWLSEQLP